MEPTSRKVQTQIQRFNFGQSVSVGQLYDACNDRSLNCFPFVKNFNYWEHTKRHFQKWEESWNTLKESKFMKRNVEPDQELSLSVKMFEPNSLGRALVQTRNHVSLIFMFATMASFKILAFQISFQQEHLNLDGCDRFIWRYDLPAEATHLTVRVEYGAFAVVTAFYDNDSTDLRPLENYLEAFKLAYSTHSPMPEYPKTFKLKVFNSLKRLCKTDLDLSRIIDEMKLLEPTDKRLYPIRYFMAPLKDLPAFSFSTRYQFHPISAEVFASSIKSLQEIDKLKISPNKMEILRELAKKYHSFLTNEEKRNWGIIDVSTNVDLTLREDVKLTIAKARKVNENLIEHRYLALCQKLLYLDSLHSAGVRILESFWELQRIGSLQTIILVFGKWCEMEKEREHFDHLIGKRFSCAFINLDPSFLITGPGIYSYKNGHFSLFSNSTAQELPKAPDLSKKLLEKEADQTILLLGETGVGKSTFINALANFLRYESYDEAEAQGLVHLIPNSFYIKDRHVRNGDVSAEDVKNAKIGHSVTKQAKAYYVSSRERRLCLIDTPGMGDTDGPPKDKENFQNIIQYIANFGEINAICILLKPNCSKESIPFKYCIKELLSSMDLSAVKNIVFCFTNTAQSDYEPGPTGPMLQKFLAELEKQNGAKIEAMEETMYCFDAEAYRCLSAQKQGVEFRANIISDCSENWELNRDEMHRLFKYIAKLAPYSSKKSTTLNQARRAVMALCTPLAELSSEIQFKIGQLETSREELTTLNQNETMLQKKALSTKIRHLISEKKVRKPRLFCQTKECEKSEVSKVCHNAWKAKTAKKNFLMQARWRIKENLGSCSACGCPDDRHELRKEYTEPEYSLHNDPQIDRDLSKNAEKTNQEELLYETLDKGIAMLRKEREEILQATAQFAHFLRERAMVTENDMAEASLLQAIQNEERLVKMGEGNKERLDGFEKTLQNYQLQKNQLMELASVSKTEILTSDEVLAKIEMMKELPYAGPEIISVLNELLPNEGTNAVKESIEQDLMA